jgi:hypothetical protein
MRAANICATTSHAARFTAGRYSFYDASMANKRQKQDQLAQSDHHIAELKQSINEQLDLIDELKRAGRDAAEDEELLDALIVILRAVLDHRLVILKRSTPCPWGQTTLLNRHGRRRQSPPRSSSG